MAEAGLAIIILAAVGVIGWRAYDLRRARRLVRLRAFAADFYPRAHVAIDDPRIEYYLLNSIMSAAEAVEKPRKAWGWVRVMLKYRLDNITKGRKYPVAPVNNIAFERECIDIMVAGLLFVAELNPLPGMIIRREALNLRRILNRRPAEVPVSPRRWVDDDMHPLAA